MKKIFTLIIVAAGGTLFSQSFSAYFLSPNLSSTVQTLTNGSIIALGTSASTDTNSPWYLERHVNLVNNTASTLTLSVIRSISYQNPTLIQDGSSSVPNTYFCFGSGCFPSNVNTPPTSADYCSLLASGATSTVYPGPYADNSQACNTPFNIGIKEGLVQGKYFVDYKVYNVVTGPSGTDAISFTVKYNELLSVEENAEVIETMGNLYPNPSTNNAQFSLVLKQESPVKIQVFNSLGSLVYTGNEQKLAGKNKLSLDCATFNSGLYFVTVTAGDSKITKRLIINK